jgi:hypothetical protein
MIKSTYDCHLSVIVCMLQFNNGDWGYCSFCEQSLFIMGEKYADRFT